jgi:6-pyruvoyltetrahydropterin/6-carboxytetrahydropterin synthase
MNTPHELTRTFRIGASALAQVVDHGNGLIGGGSPWGLAAIGELEVSVVGNPATSGYLIDIAVLDRALRATANPRFLQAARAEAATGLPCDIPALLGEIAVACTAEISRPIASLSYRPSPFRCVRVEFGSGAVSYATTPARTPATTPVWNSPMTQALLCETFEFAAAHRLHLATLSDEENRALFGKCNNPNGHGHNYRIEVAAAIPTGSAGGFGFAAMQKVVAREVMERFDHKHLNLDCPEFRQLNPSVENIAQVCHDLLKPAIAAQGATLRFVRVWETDKTSCRYPA